ncbi:hypothetical protein PG994_015219 [Apiospora phragmitis]|uniref:Uncharacterized protein n=1 Tax=Apiospora phragmitis TaxID=2905665 RepID=A0ABR1SQW9_9PEZI
MFVCSLLSSWVLFPRALLGGIPRADVDPIQVLSAYRQQLTRGFELRSELADDVLKRVVLPLLQQSAIGDVEVRSRNAQHQHLVIASPSLEECVNIALVDGVPFLA